jgi:hypothetical protein
VASNRKANRKAIHKRINKAIDRKTKKIKQQTNKSSASEQTKQYMNTQRRRLIPLDAFFVGVGSVFCRVFHTQIFPFDSPVFSVVQVNIWPYASVINT